MVVCLSLSDAAIWEAAEGVPSTPTSTSPRQNEATIPGVRRELVPIGAILAQAQAYTAAGLRNPQFRDDQWGWRVIVVVVWIVWTQAEGGTEGR